MSATTAATVFDREDSPILGANPFVGLTRGQVAAALARFTSSPTPANLLLMEPAVQSAELITCFLRSGETHT